MHSFPVDPLLYFFEISGLGRVYCLGSQDQQVKMVQVNVISKHWSLAHTEELLDGKVANRKCCLSDVSCSWS